MSKIELPVTRYYGSKRKLVTRIWEEIELTGVSFDSVLDIFGGSGSFAYYAKKMGKLAIYNDIFEFNCLNAVALVANSKNPISNKEVTGLLNERQSITYKTVISDHYQGIYYTEVENRQIDVAVQNILRLKSYEKRAAAFYILFQSCLIKRPYNIFHRNNLNLRTNYSGGRFGNKITWERPFSELFMKFQQELATFSFDNGKKNLVVHGSALNCKERADLIYIDPPYFHESSHVSYHSRYHFLEGLANYNFIQGNIKTGSKHKEIQINKSFEFERKESFMSDLKVLLSIHSDSIIVLSYRNNGIPSIPELVKLLKQFKKKVKVVDLGKYSYALNRNNDQNFEFLLIGI